MKTFKKIFDSYLLLSVNRNRLGTVSSIPHPRTCRKTFPLGRLLNLAAMFDSKKARVVAAEKVNMGMPLGSFAVAFSPSMPCSQVFY